MENGGAQSSVWGPFYKILSVGGIAGLIAFIITLAMCKRYVVDGDTEFPEVMKYSLTTIIGFYFGTSLPAQPKHAVKPPDSN